MQDVILTNIYDALFGQSPEAVARRLGLDLDADERTVRAALGIPAQQAITQYMRQVEEWKARQPKGYPGYIVVALQTGTIARSVAVQYEMAGYTMGPDFARAALLY